MEPLPETRAAFGELDVDHDGLEEQLQDAAQQVRALVPDCVGVSLAMLREGVSFTLVATNDEVALLDAVQYLAGGPCVDGALGERVLEEQLDDLLGERRWQLFAEAGAAAAVRSSLTLPILAGGGVIGSVNLYGGSRHSFTGLHEDLAAIFGAWAPGAVTNADLSFRTAAEARKAPQRLAEKRTIDTATGIVSQRMGVTTDMAARYLEDAAHRAGVGVVDLARTVVDTLRWDDAAPGDGPAEMN